MTGTDVFWQATYPLFSQKFSFAAAKATAVAVLEGVKRARKRAGLVVGPVAAVW